MLEIHSRAHAHVRAHERAHRHADAVADADVDADKDTLPWKTKITNAFTTDLNSRLGTYLVEIFVLLTSAKTSVIITTRRTSDHNLYIEAD